MEKEEELREVGEQEQVVAEPAEAEPVGAEADAGQTEAEGTSSADESGPDEPIGEGTPERPAEEAGGLETALASETEPEAPAGEASRTFTQEQVDKIAGKSREEGRRRGYEQAKREFQERYGVSNDDELDDIYSKGSRFDELSARYDDRDGLLKQAQTELALVKSGIDSARYDDVKAILAAKGMDVTEEAISSLLPTHPEWKVQPKEAPADVRKDIPQPTERLSAVGTIPLPTEDGKGTEMEQAERLFGLKIKK